MNIQPSFGSIYVLNKKDKETFDGLESDTNKDYAFLYGVTRDAIFEPAAKFVNSTTSFVKVRDKIEANYGLLPTTMEDNFLLITNDNDQVKSTAKPNAHQGSNKYNDALGDYSLFLQLQEEQLDEKAALKELVNERPHGVKSTFSPNLLPLSTKGALELIG